MTEKDKHEHAAPPPAAPAPAQEAKPPIAAKEPLAGGIKGATGQPAVSLPPEAYMTEQEKDALKSAEKPADKKETK